MLPLRQFPLLVRTDLEGLSFWECLEVENRSSQGSDHLREAVWELAVQAEHVTTSTGVSTRKEDRASLRC